MLLLRVLSVSLIAIVLAAQTDIFPLAEVRPGLRGIGKTIFSGDHVEEFDVEIIGVLDNIGPKQSAILARLSGGPLDKTGVLQGMSGSPVYVDGRLLGAVAFSFTFSTEPIAGIRPIEEMLRPLPTTQQTVKWVQIPLAGGQPADLFPQRAGLSVSGSRLVEIATPLSFAGFTRKTIDEFAPQLRALGLEPMQGISSGGSPSREVAEPDSLRPGSMISVQLLTGDLSLGAEGTLTHIDGKTVYAFGHRFLSVGSTELPFARAEVLTVAPNLGMSFKISAPREWAGAITRDYSTGVAGELGRHAAMVPLSIIVTGHGGPGNPTTEMNYNIRVVDDRYLSPFLIQMAVYSAIDATERTLGIGTLSMKGQIEFEDGTSPVRLDDAYTGAGNVPMQTSVAAALPLAYLLQSGFDTLSLKRIALEIEVFNERRQWRIDQVWPENRSVRPGEDLDLVVVLLGANGEEQVRRVTYSVPVGAQPGPLHFTVADGNTTNLTEYRHLVNEPLRSPAQVVSFLNGLRSNTKAYVRVWRPDRGFRVHGRSLPGPPASVALILGRGQSAEGDASIAYRSKIAELEIDGDTAVISGSKTIQVEVKE